VLVGGLRPNRLSVLEGASVGRGGWRCP
jgi:hypothetical protein